ncbi:hypothetical protein [Actinoplanes philippinensis]|uniref:hypothetical protein n=1 Tax=Actinoplanes philippinensis TaxID=35752 RepID=UPI0011605AAA|nr:hypothetical protein [Actinoplanes philippinensis]
MAEHEKPAIAEAFTVLRKACDELLATLDRIAAKERADVVYIPPEYPLEIALKKGRAGGFARSAEIAHQLLDGEVTS